jgi:hypothetical protein
VNYGENSAFARVLKNVSSAVAHRRALAAKAFFCVLARLVSTHL